jgi:hypothetical protein
VQSTVQQISFLTKIKMTDPGMSEKLNSKTHLQNKFSDFLSHFMHIWLQSMQYEQKQFYENFFGKNQKRLHT